MKSRRAPPRDARASCAALLRRKMFMGHQLGQSGKQQKVAVGKQQKVAVGEIEEEEEEAYSPACSGSARRGRRKGTGSVFFDAPYFKPPYSGSQCSEIFLKSVCAEGNGTGPSEGSAGIFMYPTMIHPTIIRLYLTSSNRLLTVTELDFLVSLS